MHLLLPLTDEFQTFHLNTFRPVFFIFHTFLVEFSNTRASDVKVATALHSHEFRLRLPQVFHHPWPIDCD